MVRRKVYTKDYILKAAFEVFRKNGFSGLTARNVADQMRISTQPIYLEFKNMDDLKKTLLDSIYDHVTKELFILEKKSDTAMDFGVNFITFAKKQPTIYNYLFTEKHGYGAEIKARTLNGFRKRLKEDEKYNNLSEKNCEEMHDSLLIVASGVASMSISGIFTPSREQINELLKKTIQASNRENN